MMTRTRKAKTITEDTPTSVQQQNKKQKQTATNDSDDNMTDIPEPSSNSTPDQDSEPPSQNKEGLNASIHSNEMNLDADTSLSVQQPQPNTEVDLPQKQSVHNESSTEDVGESSNTNNNDLPLNLENLNLSSPDDFFLYTLFSSVNGINKNEKIENIEKDFSHINSFRRIETAHEYHQDFFFMIFNNVIDRDAHWNVYKQHSKTTYSKLLFENDLEKAANAENVNFLRNTIFLRHVPTSLNENQIRNYFSRWEKFLLSFKNLPNKSRNIIQRTLMKIQITTVDLSL